MNIKEFLFRRVVWVWENLLFRFFSYSSRCYFVERKTKFFSHECNYLQEFVNKHKKLSLDKRLICKITQDQADVDIALSLLNTVYKNLNDHPKIDLITIEILAKLMAYRTLKKGQMIPLLIKEKEGSFKRVEYVVDHVFDLWNKVTAYGLRDCKKKESPILLFRGTDFSLLRDEGRATILSDLDPSGPGKSLYEHAGNTVRSWLSNVTENGKKARVIGHSLGGAFTLYAVILDHNLLTNDCNTPSVAFNFPGVSQELLNIWNQIPRDKRPSFQGFIGKGDIVSKFGLLFGDVWEFSSKESLPPNTAHERIFLAHIPCVMKKVNVPLENQSNSRKFYSRIQKNASSTFYKMGLKKLFPKN